MLRLSHPRFAYLKWVLETLFYSVQFDADPQHVERLARTDLSLIAPFVNKVILAAPAHSWTCTFEIFKALVQSQALPDSRYYYDDLKKILEQYLQDCIILAIEPA